MLIKGNNNSMSGIIVGGGAPAPAGGGVVIINKGGGESFGAPVYLLVGTVAEGAFGPIVAGVVSIGDVIPASPMGYNAFEFSGEGSPLYIASGVEIVLSVLGGDADEPITLYALTLGEGGSFTVGDELGAGEWVDGKIVVTVPALAGDQPVVGIAFVE